MNKPVASSHYLTRHPALRLPGGIERAELLHDETVDAWADWFEAAGRKRPAALRGPVYADFNLLASAVLAGHGVALCPVEVFRREIACGDLRILSDVATLTDRHYVMIRAKPTTPAVTAFEIWFTQLCAGPRRSP